MNKVKLANAIQSKQQFVPMLVNAVDGFYPQKSIVNSWFYIGRCHVEGQELVFLFHVMTGTVMKAGLLNTVVSVLNKSTGYYKSKDSVIKSIRPVDVKNGNVLLKSDFAEMSGNMEKTMHLKASFDGCGLDVTVQPVGNVIYNGGNGFFPLPNNKNNWQYSCPEMTMDGTITIDGKSYAVKDGSCWFDRQYNQPEVSFTKLSQYDPKWLWIGIHLDNGEAISLWEIIGEDKQTHYCFATVLHTDGSQSVYHTTSAIAGSSDIWHSDVTGQNYPTKWEFEIPDLQAKYTVICNPKQQEIVSSVPALNKYEAESQVECVCKGETVTGSGCVELLGKW